MLTNFSQEVQNDILEALKNLHTGNQKYHDLLKGNVEKSFNPLMAYLEDAGLEIVLRQPPPAPPPTGYDTPEASQRYYRDHFHWRTGKRVLQIIHEWITEDRLDMDQLQRYRNFIAPK